MCFISLGTKFTIYSDLTEVDFVTVSQNYTFINCPVAERYTHTHTHTHTHTLALTTILKGHMLCKYCLDRYYFMPSIIITNVSIKLEFALLVLLLK